MPNLKFLVDAQLPPALAMYIESQGCEARAARDVGLRTADDSTIWRYAESGQWVIVTKDEDFVYRTLATRTGPQILWLRIGNTTNRILSEWFAPQFKNVIQQFESGNRLVELNRKRS